MHTDLKQPSLAEEIAVLLGDDVSGWRDELAVDQLRVCAIEAAHAAAERLARPGPPADEEWITAMLELERGRHRYVWMTGRYDASEVIYEAAEFAVGATVATILEGTLDRLQAALSKIPDEELV